MSADTFSYAEDLQLITEAATAAGQLALPYFRGDQALDVKLKAGDSPVSAADYAVNTYLMEALGSARPNYGWLSEETTDTNKTARIDAPRTFVVDPIDGTRGFIEGRDIWCVSVGVIENGRPVAAVLVCSARNETFTAAKGEGAYLNGARLQLDDQPHDELIMGGPRVYLDVLDAKTKTVFTRHPHIPSLAYRIAMVANGRLSATFIKPNAHDWDIAAADLIVHEAGGVLVDQNGGKFQLNQESPIKTVMVACHPKLLDQMLTIVEETPFS